MLVNTLEKVLGQLNLKANVSSFKREGPFAVFNLSLNPGGKFKQIENYSTEIALALRAIAEPIIYPITKEGVVRMEIMLSEQQTVLFRNIQNVESNDSLLPLILGQQRNGDSLIADLTQMPHLLVSGATGSGKSVMLHSIINSLLLTPNVRLVLMDPKRVEFSCYDGIKPLFAPIAQDVNGALNLLRCLVSEMERRFIRLEKVGVRNIEFFPGKMPYLVLVIDEMADLMASSKKEFQHLVCKLAQKSRACGIHIVAATQRPSVDVITGVIKANFPARIACRVSSQADSRTILNQGGAEKLLGRGDAILNCEHHNFVRFKGAFLSEEDILYNVSNATTWWSKIWNG